MDHIIDGTIDDSVGVGSDRADHTHVFLNSGGTITGDVLVGEDGLFVMRGGTVGGLVHAGGDGRVTISGGVVGGDVVAFFDIGRVTLEGGSMMGDFIVD